MTVSSPAPVSIPKPRYLSESEWRDLQRAVRLKWHHYALSPRYISTYCFALTGGILLSDLFNRRLGSPFPSWLESDQSVPVLWSAIMVIGLRVPLRILDWRGKRLSARLIGLLPATQHAD